MHDLELFKFNLIPELIALVVGFATGWWAWAHGRVAVRSMAVPAGVARSVPEAIVEPPIGAGGLVADATAGVMATTVAEASTIPPPIVPPAVGAPDNLQLIKGIGPVLEKLCHSLGVSRFDQIAHWTDADIAAVDHHLAGFHGRIVEDHWVEQAGMLARGDFAGHAIKFGKEFRNP